MTNGADSINLEAEYQNATNLSVGATTDNLPPGVLYRVKATYKYTQEDVDELSFDVGEIIRVVEYDDPEEQVCNPFSNFMRIELYTTKYLDVRVKLLLTIFLHLFVVGRRMVNGYQGRHQREGYVPSEFHETAVRAVVGSPFTLQCSSETAYFTLR